jgi:hypothetical protein
MCHVFELHIGISSEILLWLWVICSQLYMSFAHLTYNNIFPSSFYFITITISFSWHLILNRCKQFLIQLIIIVKSRLVTTIDQSITVALGDII